MNIKTLLITIGIFLSCNLMGQIYDPNAEQKLDTTLMVIYDDYYNDDIYVEFNFKDYVDAKIDKRIIELWKEYQIECRNDSTVRYEDCSRNDGSLVGCYRRIVTYKKPTFEGFILFIERKINSQ